MKKTSHALKQDVIRFKKELCDEFTQKNNIVAITRKLVHFVDETLIDLFHKHRLHEHNHFCLLALGGYGRRELQLHSDIDLLLLHEETVSKNALQQAQLFIQDCWDIGLDLSHQITTVAAYSELASHDLSAISTILDMMLLCGNGHLMETLRYQTHPLHMWPSLDYLYAKQIEQRQRYKKYGETAYNLEPNVKQGAGGLRDIHTLLCIAKRHFGITRLADGIYCGFITDKEYEELIHCLHFLWRVRFALHMLAGKQEERLLFEYQIQLAALFGFEDKKNALAIEQFMKAYFKIIKRIRELNEMLLDWFSEVIVNQEKQVIIPLDEHFQLVNQCIEVKHSTVFARQPKALLQLFLWLAERSDIVGVKASTIRLITQHLYLMNQAFLTDKSNTDLFLALFKNDNNPYRALQHMNRYGVLGHYLDCFAAVTGQMQYDLFHVYTVDQHTLFVIRNLVRFLSPQHNQPFALAASIMAPLPKKEILYLAALFHDIAKGQGGDHSELGADEAAHFADRHHLEQEDKKLLVWLVRHHLLMSHTAQRQDIYDPNTIALFCQKLPQPHYLDYLYLLTVADICATNQSLWNTWKDSLLKELYHTAYHVLHQEKALINEAALIQARQQQAMKLLISQGVKQQAVEQLWSGIKRKFFLHEPPEVIARHTKDMVECQRYPLVRIMPHHSQGGTEVFIYNPHRDERFTITTTVLSNHRTTIQEASILTCDNHFDMDTYIILDEQNQAFLDKQRQQLIREALQKQLAEKKLPNITKRRLSRAQAHFKRKAEISFSDDLEQHLTCLFLITVDRPGLLAKVSHVFTENNIHLHQAKILTAGERVEDMFYISNQTGSPLTKEEQEQLKAHLIEQLTKFE